MINLLFSTVIHMMAQSTPFTVLVAVLIINTLSYCSAESVYCVTPTATSCSSCPHNSTYCTTLSEYAQEGELYFMSNTTMVFLPGDHVLDTNITVVNVTRLTIHGEFSSGNVATVVRNGSVGFSFTNMVDFNIYFLAFTSYNRSLSYHSYSASISALFLQSTPSVKLVNCSFHDNLGTALAVNNTNVTLAENIKFIRNQCACQSFSEVHGYGCGITALNSNLVFTGKSFFCETTQTTFSYSYCAGAIWASGSSLHFNGTNNFNGNSAKGTKGVGVVIYATSNTTMSFSGISNFTHNSAESGGAIATVRNVVVIFHGTNNFINNSAWFGGAIFADTNSHLSFSGTSDFSRNSADYGGAIYADINSSLNFIGTSAFSHNSADYEGGAIDVETNSNLSFSGTSNFSHNSAQKGGAIHADSNSYLTFNGTSNFSHNSANYSGAINVETNSYLTFNGTSDFSHNSADYEGGAIHADTNSSLSFSGTSAFCHNSAQKGGAINTGNDVILTFDGTNIFFSNSATENGGAIYAKSSILLSFIGTSDFSHNSAERCGGAIEARVNVALTFTETSNFFNNSASSVGGGAIYVAYNASLSFIGTSCLTSNSAVQGGAIFAYESTMAFNGKISFTNNRHNTEDRLTDSRGGAMYLYISSAFSIMPNTTVHWENNHAHLGGAIYVYDANPYIYCTKNTSVPKQKCFFQLPGQNLTSGLDIQLVFKNNSADIAGSVLYGSAIDNCKLAGLDSHNSSEVFDMLFQYEDDNTTSSVSSDPFCVCICENNHPDCSKSSEVLSIYPGESYQVSVVAVGQRNGMVPANVTSVNECNLLCSQTIQSTSKTCTTLNYTVSSQQIVTRRVIHRQPMFNIW